MTARWCVVVNPRAGTRHISHEDVVASFERRGLPATVHTTDSVDDLRTVVTTEIDRGTHRFAVVGGDGTGHLVVNILMDTRSPDRGRFSLAMIAAGSGSDFVRTFGQERGIDAGVSRLLEPDLYPIDIGLVSGSFGSRYFLNALNVGVAAASAKRAQTFHRRMGTVRYAAGFWVALANFAGANISVAVDRHAFDGSAINVVVANGQFFGGGMNIAPRAALTDGLFDVQVFSGPRRHAFSVMPRVIRGTHLSHKAVRRYVGADVSIEVPAAWPVEADGEILGSGSVSVAMMPSAIDFVV